MGEMAMSAQMFGLILRLHALPSYILHMENKKLRLCIHGPYYVFSLVRYAREIKKQNQCIIPLQWHFSTTNSGTPLP